MAVEGVAALQWTEVERVGERVRAELGALVRSFPLEVRTIAQVSEWLGVSFPVCQRVSRAIRHRGDPVEALTFLPGLQGLRQYVSAAQARGCSPELVTAAEAACRHYSDLIDGNGGSQARLLARLKSAQGASQPTNGASRTHTDADLLRQQGFDANRQVTGREFETQLGVFAYAPSTSHAGRIDAVSVLGMVGIRRAPNSLPICPLQLYNTVPEDELPPKQSDRPTMASFPGNVLHPQTPVGLVEEFCSQPLPRIATRSDRGNLLVLIDPDGETRDPFDVFLGSQYLAVDDPRTLNPPMQHSTLVSRGPARNLLLDVYAHRSLAQASLASVASYLVSGRGVVGNMIQTPDGARREDPAERWFDRLSEQIQLEYLELGAVGRPPRSYARLPELSQRVFDSQGWQAADFVGYRCEVRYPVWGVQYLLSLDFAESATDEIDSG